MFEKAKMYYENGVWSKEILQLLVSRGKLTREPNGNTTQRFDQYSNGTNFAGSMAADIPAGGHIPAAFELTYKGAIVNPQIKLVGSSSNTTYGICALNATLADNESFAVSTFYGRCKVEITGADGVATDALNDVDLAYEPFPRIPVNEDCVLLMSADSDIGGRATVRVYYYYRSV